MIKKIVTTFIFAILAAMPQAQAQFIDIDWEQISRDTLLPQYSTVLSLPEDAHLYKYSATIEYPEFKPMSKAEIKHYRLETLQDTLPQYPNVHTYVSTAAKQHMLDVSFTPVVCIDGRFM